MDKKALIGWQTKQDEGGNLILSFEQEKLVQKHSWKNFFVCATMRYFLLTWKGTGTQVSGKCSA